MILDPLHYLATLGMKPGSGSTICTGLSRRLEAAGLFRRLPKADWNGSIRRCRSQDPTVRQSSATARRTSPDATCQRHRQLPLREEHSSTAEGRDPSDRGPSHAIEAAKRPGSPIATFGVLLLNAGRRAVASI